MVPYDVISGRELLPTEQLLLEGGDARIALGPDGRTNRYGCSPRPDPGMLAFGSSTATTISHEGFAAAERLRERLLATGTQAPGLVYARELERMRKELAGLCELDDLRGLDIAFGASGTDLHLIAASLVTGAGSLRVIVAGAEETGRGVPLAVAGCHFSARSALGQAVAEGKPVAKGSTIEVVTVPIRASDGTPRPVTEIDSEVEALAHQAIAMKQRVLLVVVDVSKTGMIAPSPACASALRRRLDGSLDVMVDACQFRITPATLRAYLQHDFMVAITGSKFLTGPTFAGALFIPAGVARRARERPLPQALSAYSARADWPADWKAAQSLNEVSNFGLLLRWEAALQELRAFRAVPATAIAQCLRAFALAVTRRLQEDPAFEPLPVPALDRRPLREATGWDHVATIFPFLLRCTTGGNPLNRERTMMVYQLLQHELDFYPATDTPRCQFGQPVDCGERNGVPVSALRICASARLVIEATARDGAHIVVERAMAALDKAALLARAAE